MFDFSSMACPKGTLASLSLLLLPIWDLERIRQFCIVTLNKMSHVMNLLATNGHVIHDDWVHDFWAGSNFDTSADAAFGNLTLLTHFHVFLDWAVYADLLKE